jgi:hypothetical protein
MDRAEDLRGHIATGSILGWDTEPAHQAVVGIEAWEAERDDAGQ